MLKELIYLLGLSTLLLFNSATPLLAQPDSAPESQGGSGGSAPRTAGSGSRGPGSCAITDPDSSEPQSALTAMVPENNILSTQQDQINLYFFIPPETAQSAFLEIVDQHDKKIIFEQAFDLTTENTIARLVLPDTIQLLATSSSAVRYQWTLQIYCEANANIDNEAVVTLKGRIQRLESDIAAEVPSGLWSEKMEFWFAQRETHPEAWWQGLASEGLEHYADLEVQTYNLLGELEL